MTKARPSLLLIALAGISLGCSGGVASTAPVTVSQEDVDKSSIYRANQSLDLIAKLPAAQRQFVANVPKTAEALYAASKLDAATKKRIEDLGLTVTAPAPPGRHK